MGTYIRTCAEIKTPDCWQPVSYGVFPPELWHDMDGYEPPAYSEPFKDQNYGMFGFFAGERNYSKCQVISEPRGLPADISENALIHLVPKIWQLETSWEWGYPPPATVDERIARAEADSYGYSWLAAKELTEFNYEQTFTDQRQDIPTVVTYRDFLGSRFFLHLDVLKKLSARDEVRILFCFI